MLAVALVWILLGSVRYGISPCGPLWYNPLLSVPALHTRDAEIVLGVLVKIFRGDPIAADRRLARKADVALKNLVGAAANSHVGAVAVEGVVALRCSVLLWLIFVVAPSRRALT